MRDVLVKPRIRFMGESLDEKQKIEAPIPNLLDLQKKSYEKFLYQGIGEELSSYFPIVDAGDRFELSFVSYRLEEPKLSEEEVRIKDKTYEAQIKVKLRLLDKQSQEVVESEVLLGEIPIMTKRATFIVNGSERVIVNQLTRSPGVYFKEDKDLMDRKTFVGTVIPVKGNWINFEAPSNGTVWIRIEKSRKLPVSTFLKACGIEQSRIEEALVDDKFRKATFAQDNTQNREEALQEFYKKIRPGEAPNPEAAKGIINNRFFDKKRFDLGEVGRLKINEKLGLNGIVPLDCLVLHREDMLAIVKYLVNLHYGDGTLDDIDHLENRRVRLVGELVRQKFREGLYRMEHVIHERMSLYKGTTKLKISNIINSGPLTVALREFFCTGQLSQYMDQTNPLAELTHKRRISVLGPGGLTRERAGFEVRDIHPSYYGRFCPIETPEGPNVGLISSPTIYAVVNDYGFLETPYRKVKNGKLTDIIESFTASKERNVYIASADVKVENKKIVGDTVVARYNGEFQQVPPDKIDYIGVSPKQMLSLSSSLIPFVEHNDANRALMGCNMQRQAVPLVVEEAPWVGTGMEMVAAIDSGMVHVAEKDGTVRSAAGGKIIIDFDDGTSKEYKLMKFVRTNNATCFNQKALVRAGDRVKKGQVLTSGCATDSGELALGRNVLVAFMPFGGYNFEDAILISNRLVREDVFTSIHIESYEVEARSTKLGDEEITREIPNVSEEARRHLDEQGIVVVGTEVEAGDYLVGKLTPKGDVEPPSEERLLRAIFGDKLKDMRDTSLKLPHGEKGKVIDVKVFSRNNGDDLPPGVITKVRVTVAQLRKISVGDKMTGRHGNKGVISKILPEADMPYLPDGTPVDVVLNPLGVPSRMNVGQIFEVLLGLAAGVLNNFGKDKNVEYKFEATPFDESFGERASERFVEEYLEKAREIKPFIGKNGKVTLYDGKTGDPFLSPVTVGYMYLLKLVHLVDDKIHARSTGPYSLITQQPLGGKAQFGGQRFGEMEVWALEAYGAANVLQEILTIKSDDITGRTKAMEAIIKGKNLGTPGLPESFKVLVRELQGLALDITLIHQDGSQIDLEHIDEDDNNVLPLLKSVDVEG
ncbi:DNA-directed RNA polymerase subunit beta [Thermodesulfobium narugense DSM 14796]|uniref:DNA-directed RNA polymerase subunit beta n=1 Tax=Thermodesulfobium narugense DSM 14796 TaxID=747365 RepID=M1E594_9BACT|nr:DNA-directed RNA polymerase subunit beta [Thermodesulfobium narugense]AEE14917.1 DNA-directed RNA polymerase subunit beta [Thermodesulfobium narugense DSM 14796]